MPDNIDLIRACHEVMLHSLHEAGDLDLRLVLHEARTGDPLSRDMLAAEPPQLRPLLAGALPVAHGPGCKVFELTWEAYVAYAVRNESYAQREPETSRGTGQRVVEYVESTYLDHVRRTTFANDKHPGPLKHWCIHCAFHVIDVVSTHEPTIVVR